MITSEMKQQLKCKFSDSSPEFTPEMNQGLCSLLPKIGSVGPGAAEKVK